MAKGNIGRIVRVFFEELFKDERETVSVKPVIAVFGALFLIGGMVFSLFVDIQPANALVDAVVIITCIGMGADSLDKFSVKAPKKEETKEPEV